MTKISSGILKYSIVVAKANELGGMMHSLPIFVTKSGNVFIQLIYLGIVTIFVNLIADVSYAFMSSYFFQTSSIKTKKLINTISGSCLVLIGIYLFFSRFL